MNHQRLTDDHKVRFLELLRTTGNPSVAARAIGFAPATVKRHRDADAEFEREWHEALDEATDALEAEARRRAVEGVVRTKWIGPAKDGGFVEEIDYSDGLLTTLLKANNPNKFADRSKTELTSPDGSMAVVDDAALAAKLASLLAIAQERMAKGQA